MCYGRGVSDEVSVRELRNHTADVLRRVESGERLRVTVDRRPVAELVPLPARAVWVSRRRVVHALVQAAAGLRDDLADAWPDTVDDVCEGCSTRRSSSPANRDARSPSISSRTRPGSRSSLWPSWSLGFTWRRPTTPARDGCGRS